MLHIAAGPGEAPRREAPRRNASGDAPRDNARDNARDTSPDGEASAGWRALGTLVRLVVTDPRCLPEATGMLEADLAAVDLACSRFRADSELSGLRTASGRPVRVSPLLAEAIAVALRAARLTDGDVDPTVGAAMSAVGYDRDFDRIPRTGPPLRVTARTVPGWRDVHLEGRLLSMPEGTQLDLGATAKAWAADRAVARIAAAYSSSGGDLAAKLDESMGHIHAWRIAALARLESADAAGAGDARGAPTNKSL